MSRSSEARMSCFQRRLSRTPSVDDPATDGGAGSASISSLDSGLASPSPGGGTLAPNTEGGGAGPAARANWSGACTELCILSHANWKRLQLARCWFLDAKASRWMCHPRTTSVENPCCDTKWASVVRFEKVFTQIWHCTFHRSPSEGLNAEYSSLDMGGQHDPFGYLRVWFRKERTLEYSFKQATQVEAMVPTQ